MLGLETMLLVAQTTNLLHYDAMLSPDIQRRNILRTPIRAPKANAVCERILGSVRRECLGHMLIFTKR